MDALPFDPVELRATDAARNIQRRWCVIVSRDLFGHVMVETGWGRIGARGRSLMRSFTDETQAHRYIRALLARRASARVRTGVAYLPDGARGRADWG